MIIFGIAAVGLLIRSSRRNGSSPGDRHPSPDAAEEKLERWRPDELSSAPRAPRNHFAPPPARPIIEGSAYVVDGDSLRINGSAIRLFGIDAPELNHPYGKISKSAMVRLCKGQTVKAEIFSADVHGRKVARCTLPDGRDLSAELVKLGLAIDWPKFSGGAYRDLEPPDARKKLWLAVARHNGHMHVWESYEKRRNPPA
ncbi:MAG: thermonuclease family protein [Alphaproteobacteria bacterium]|nr:thermonuclease family protein [Alphaproteobacteria bacterium]